MDPSIAPEAPPLPEPRRILPGERVRAVAEVLLCSGFPSQLLLIQLLGSLGMSMMTPEGQLSPLFVFTLSLIDAPLVIALVFVFLYSHGERPGAILLGQRKVVGEALLGVLLTPFVFLLVVVLLAIVLTLAPSLHNVPRNPFEDLLQTRNDAVVFAIVATFAGGVREEIQRAFIVHRFDGYLGGGALGVALYSIVFGLGHVQQGIDAALLTALLGAIWGTVYLLRRSVVAPMVSHAGFNLAQLAKYVVLQ